MELDAIWKRARNDLTITTKMGDMDLFLWEHCVRVSQVAQRIAKLPVVQARQPDEAAIAAAGLYHDAGWAIRFRAGEVERYDILLSQASDTAYDQAAALMEQSLADLVSAPTLERASHAIRTFMERDPDSIEGQVLAEANHLEEFGLLMLWQAIRRGMVEGKAVQAVLDTWRRRKEYQFWTARLKDSFRFKPIREIAEQRLKTLEHFMEELQAEHAGLDIKSTDTSEPLPHSARPAVG